MIKKFIFIGMMLTIMFSVYECRLIPRQSYAYDCVSVTICKEYSEKFEAEEFTVEDFQWDNAERIIYDHSPNYPEIIIYLKKHSKKQISKAIEHLETLDFVEQAERVFLYHSR